MSNVSPQVTAVPLLDLTRSLETLQAPMRAAFEQVMQSGQYILGPEVTAFETAAAAYCGTPHALGVSSGTDALLLALMACGIGQGDEVICPTYSFFATAGSIWRLGATPVFVDSCPACFNMLPRQVAERISERTRAILPVHLFGQCADMQSILNVARAYDLPVIEDAAQALGAEAQANSRAGAMGTVGCFSFFPSKNLGAMGDAGLVTCRDDKLLRTMTRLRVHGQEPKYHHGVVGANFRIDALQAAILAVKLPLLDAQTSGRQTNAALYNKLFENSGLAGCRACLCGRSSQPLGDIPMGAAPIMLPGEYTARHIYNQYVLTFANQTVRDHVREHLRAHRVGCEVYYPIALHLQPCFAALGYQEGEYPHAEQAARCSLALPIFPELREEEIHYVAHHVVQAVRAVPGT